MSASVPNMAGLALGFVAALLASLAVELILPILGMDVGLPIKTAIEGSVGAAVISWLSLQDWVQKPGSHEESLSSKNTGAIPGPIATFNLIKKRRSIFPKDFNGEQVDPKSIEKMLEAANWAPTHGKTEPWRFVVLSGEGRVRLTNLTIEHVRTSDSLSEEERQKKLTKYAKKLPEWEKASYFIAIVMKRYAVDGKAQPEWEEMSATACAVQNIYLMATSLGVHGYWSSWDSGARESQAMGELLDMDHPEDKCLGFFIVGAADAAVVAGYRAKRGDIRDKVTWMDV